MAACWTPLCGATGGLHVWIGLTIIAVDHVSPFDVAAKELAPTEDQGFIFGIVKRPADATIDQTTLYADAAGKSFMSVPEAEFTFQITFPDNGFGGMVLKPWDERKATVFRIARRRFRENSAAFPAFRCPRHHAPRAARRRQFSGRIRPFLDGGPGADSGVRASSCNKRPLPAECSAFPPMMDTKIDQPQAELVWTATRSPRSA